MQQGPRSSAALDNRPMHRRLRHRRGPATSAGLLRYRPGATGWYDRRTPGVWGAV